MRQWAGIASLGNGRTGYLLDSEGVAWAELEYHHEDDRWDEAAGGWRMPVTARYRRGGSVEEERFPASRPACLAAAERADGPWLEPGDPVLSLLKADPQTGDVLNGLLSGQQLWDVEWRLNPASMPADADPSTRLLYSSPMHPFTRVLGEHDYEAVAYADRWLRANGMNPADYLFEAHPSEKDL